MSGLAEPLPMQPTYVDLRQQLSNYEIASIKNQVEFPSQAHSIFNMQHGQ